MSSTNTEGLSEKVLIDKLKRVSEKNKEENMEQMMRILIDGANHQINYLHNGELLFAHSEEDSDFFDI